jgi:hypothetical protein
VRFFLSPVPPITMSVLLGIEKPSGDRVTGQVPLDRLRDAGFELDIAELVRDARGNNHDAVFEVAAKTADSYWVGAYLGQWFDRIADLLDVGEITQQAMVRALQETWPSTWNLYYNGSRDRFAPAALYKLEDPEDATLKWQVLSVAGTLLPRRGERPSDFYMNIAQTALDNMAKGAGESVSFTEAFVESYGRLLQHTVSRPFSQAVLNVAQASCLVSTEQEKTPPEKMISLFRRYLGRAQLSQNVDELVDALLPSAIKVFAGALGIAP